MTTLSWNLSADAPNADGWFLFIDGRPDYVALNTYTPYVGAGQYSVDLTRIPSYMLPRDGAAHSYTLALHYADGTVGTQSTAVSSTLPTTLPAALLAQISQAPSLGAIQLPVAPLPTADTVLST
jgi:hypothetical protein